MIKILLYEPGRAGHRPVYLGYLRESFTEAGCEVLVVTDDYKENPRDLAKLASTHGCKWIFVCTIDGLYFWLFRLGVYCRLQGIRVAGIYYLFNNLYEGWRRWLWRFLLSAKLVYTIFVPDLLHEDRPKSEMHSRILPIPDTWDSRLLKPVERVRALRACNIADCDNGVVFLVIGAISLRKGLDHLLAVLAHWDFNIRSDFILIVAGKIEPDAVVKLMNFCDHNPNLRKHLKIHDSWLSDNDICNYYGASAYLCALYPKEFKVSISTVIKAMAVNRPVIVGDHGMIGNLVQRLGNGLTCNTSDINMVKETFECAYDAYKNNYDLYSTMSNAANDVVSNYELDKYKNTFKKWISIQYE